MKTKNYSISMRAILTIVAVFSFTAFVNAQFVTPSPDSPVTQSLTAEDVRTGSTITYTLDGAVPTGEDYTWVVSGGIITAVNNGVVEADQVTVLLTTDANQITVEWDQAPTAIASVAGKIQVQKVSAAGCPSQLQILDVDVWNLPTANIADVDVAICSGENTDGSITVNFTGAPSDDANDAGFDVTYTITRSDASLTTVLAGDPTVAATTVSTDASSRTIPLPADLLNTSTVDQTLTVTITAANDDLSDQLATSLIKSTYVITVHPVPTTGDIVSSPSAIGRRL